MTNIDSTIPRIKTMTNTITPGQALSQSLSQGLQEITFLSGVGQGGSSSCFFTKQLLYFEAWLQYTCLAESVSLKDFGERKQRKRREEVLSYEA